MSHNKLGQLTRVALAVSLGVSCVGVGQAASAQSVADAFNFFTSSLGAVFNRQPQQIPNRNVSVFTGNLNSNNFNFCALPSCQIPSVASNPVTTVAPRPIPQPGIVPSSGTLVRPPLPSNVAPVPGFPISPQAVPQLTPPRPVLSIPPIPIPLDALFN
jgi:hypothetical protein